MSITDGTEAVRTRAQRDLPKVDSDIYMYIYRFTRMRMVEAASLPVRAFGSIYILPHGTRVLLRMDRLLASSEARSHGPYVA